MLPPYSSFPHEDQSQVAFPAYSCPFQLSDSSHEAYNQKVAEEIVNSVPEGRLDLFATELQAVASASNRYYLLCSLKAIVENGAWSNPDQYLPTAIQMLKGYPENVELQEIATALAYIPPSRNITLTMLETPEDLLWWADLLNLLPHYVQSAEFYYPRVALESIQMLRKAIIERNLQGEDCGRISLFSQERLAAFLYLLRIEQLNEDEDYIGNILLKAIEQHQSTVYMRNSHAFPAANEHFQGFSHTEMRNSGPLSAFSGLKTGSKPSIIEVWMHRILPDIGKMHIILPIPLPDFISSFAPQGLLSDKEILAYYQLQLVRLCFPQLLLLSELSQESHEVKQRLARDWYQSHSINIDDYLRKAFYSDNKKLICVFTRDMQDAKLQLNLEFTQENANKISSIPELRANLAAFLQNPVQRLYILDYFLDFPSEIELQEAKLVLEEAAGLRESKLICLLVRLPADYPPIPGIWSRKWSLVSFESLSEPFSSSFKSLQKWLNRDTRSIISHRNFTSSQARISSILLIAYGQFASSSLDEIKTLSNNREFCAVISDRLRKEAVTPADWRKRALLQRDKQWFLREKAESAFIEIAGELLSPVILTVKRYQAFHSLLNAGENSLIGKLWTVTFLTLQPDNSDSLIRPQVPLLYPFIQKDYDTFVAPRTPGDFGSFPDLSVTKLHMNVDSRTPKDLLQVYLEDLATLDLAEATYGEQGKAVLVCLCRKSRSFYELMKRYCENRESVLALCSAKPCSLLDDFFESIIGTTPGGDIDLDPVALCAQIRAVEEELSFLLDPTVRLFTVNSRFLYIFNCSRKEIIKKQLNQAISAKYSSLILIKPDRVFSCGGEEIGLFSNGSSAQACVITLPNTLIVEKNMRQKRIYHGLAVCQEHVYAIGGSDHVKNLQTCEKFSLKSRQWSTLASVVQAGRACFTPLVYTGIIYIIGGEADLTTIETIDPRTDLISALDIAIPRVNDCISLFLDACSLLVISSSQVCRLDLVGKRFTVQGRRKTQIWSAYPPVMHKGEVYYVDMEKDRPVFRWMSVDGEMISQREVQ